MGGSKYLSENLTNQLIEELESPSSQMLHESLSSREFEVMIMIANGKSVGEIAVDLALSVNTITSYRSRIMNKMNMTTNAELIRYSIENKLIQ